MPLVSVIVATYNRSRVLAHAIDSVRRSSLTDLEALVIGDHCTDDSADVVAGCRDDRITFVNLPRNTGEQSGPSNEGLRLARGKYVAFLNHDDMYLSDHLASAVACLEQTGADFVWVPVLVILPASPADLAEGRWSCRLSAVPPRHEFDPRIFVFASAWVLKRELAAAVGPWRSARQTFVPSSQDWLFRVWRSGARMRFHPSVTVVAVPAGARRGSYADAASPEHDFFSAQIATNPRFRDVALERAAVTAEAEMNAYRVGRSSLGNLRALLVRPVSAAAVACGVHPLAPFFALRYGRRGNLIDAVRKRVGLTTLD